MDKNKRPKAEKLQIKLDKLLQTKEKKQQTFEKSKLELNAISKEIENMKLKLFELLQNGSDDATFSNWAKRKINENGNSTKHENTVIQNQQLHTEQNQNQ